MFVGFFEVYDLTVLTIGAPQIADGLGVSIGLFGVGVAVIRLAALGSVPILRAADRIGRRTMLLVSIAAFTAATGLTALASGLVAFVAIQIVARAFLATESSLGAVVISEEVRKERRGAALSLVGVISFLGPGLTALAILAVPLTPLDWRIFYVIALPPLLAIAYLRRNLGETKAFSVAETEDRLQQRLIPVVPEPYASRLRRIATVFGVAEADPDRRVLLLLGSGAGRVRVECALHCDHPHRRAVRARRVPPRRAEATASVAGRSSPPRSCSA